MKGKFLRALPIAALLTVSLTVPAAAEVINGTGGPDVLVGTPTADVIHGYGGVDKIYGKAGTDRLYGGVGADRLYPGKDSKRDVLRGGPGPDRIWARIGPGGRGADVAYGGLGNDWIRVINVHGWAMPGVNCGPGYDTVVLPRGFDAKIGGCEHIVSRP